MVATLNRARDEEYEELLNTIERFEDEVARETHKGKFTFAALEEVEDEYARLERWFARIRDHDLFEAPNRSTVAAELGRPGAALRTFTGEVHRHEGAHTAGGSLTEGRAGRS